jgi:hypothetical protein
VANDNGWKPALLLQPWIADAVTKEVERFLLTAIDYGCNHYTITNVNAPT